MSIYLKLTDLQNQIDAISTRGITTAGSANLTNGLTASYISGTTAISGALIYAGQASTVAVSGSGGVSGSLVYAGQLTGSAISGTLIYAGRLTGSAVSSSLAYANNLIASSLNVSQDNLVISKVNKGVDLTVNSTGLAATITDNILKTYEAGTLNSPPSLTVIGDSSAGSATFSTQDVKYLIIGNLVLLSVDFSWTGHTGTGNMILTELPVKPNGKYTAIVNHSGLTGLVTDGNFVIAETEYNSNVIKLLLRPTGSASSTQLQIDSAASINFSLVYARI